LFFYEITGTIITNSRTVLGSNLGEDIGFRNNNSSLIFNDTHSTVKIFVNVRVVKIGKKCKEMLNFPALTPQALH
jgi:hypothetical protein